MDDDDDGDDDDGAAAAAEHSHKKDNGDNDDAAAAADDDDDDDDDVVIATQATSQELPEGVYIDPEYLAALPSDLRREVKDDAIRKYEEQQRKAHERNNNTNSPDNRAPRADGGLRHPREHGLSGGGAAAATAATATAAAPAPVATVAHVRQDSRAAAMHVRRNRVGERTVLFASALGGPLRHISTGTPSLALCVSRKAVEAIVRDWVSEALDSSTDSQVAALQDYLASLLHEKRLDEALTLLRLVRRLVPSSRDPQRWSRGYNALLQRIQDVMQELYSAKLDLAPLPP